MKTELISTLMNVCKNIHTKLHSFQYRPGNVGISISIPHGGIRDDNTIPERSDGYETPFNLDQTNVSL